MKEKVIAVFDIGKTKKKVFVFDYNLTQLSVTEEKFTRIKDDDGFECEDIESIEKWIKKTVLNLVRSETFDLTAVNFTTYRSALVYIDNRGKRLTPLYSYQKPVDDNIPDYLYNKFGGKEEFCRKTASPASGMQNAGIQVLWMKTVKPEIYAKTRYILHLPQYLSFLLTDKVYSEHTSIGCQTSLWDFDNMKYHQWIRDECLPVPEPVSTGTFTEIEIEGKKVKIGIGINERSATLAPYYSSENGKFLLVSTGSRCINMNPFNSEILTIEELMRDCLCYMNIFMKPVKSSSLFLGQLHEAAVGILSKYFKIQEESFKLIKPEIKLLNKLSQKYRNRRVFFSEGISPGAFKEEIDLFEFDHFVESYHELMVELSDLTVEAINPILAEYDDTKVMYITGSFSGNDIFNKLIASSFPYLKVFTSEVKNGAALGAAKVILDSIDSNSNSLIDLGLKEVII